MRTFGKVLRWLAYGYAGLVVVVAIAVAVMLTQPAEGANFAGVWLILVTLPLSLLATMLPLQGTAALLVLTATGLVQAVLLWFIGRAIGRAA